jgi:hypothetical protein
MIPMAIGIGLTVRIGTELPKSAKKAKMMAAWCMGFTLIRAMIVSFPLYQMRIPIVYKRRRSCIGEPALWNCLEHDRQKRDALLSSQGCERIWGKVCFCMFVFTFLVSTKLFFARWGCNGTWRPSFSDVFVWRITRNGLQGDLQRKARDLMQSGRFCPCFTPLCSSW